MIEDIARVFPATVELATAAILIGAGLGIPLGVLAAVRRNRPTDHIVRLVTLLGHSTPIFWIGMVGLIVFYASLGWVGGGGRIDDFYLDVVAAPHRLPAHRLGPRGRVGDLLERAQPPHPAGLDPRPSRPWPT